MDLGAVTTARTVMRPAHPVQRVTSTSKVRRKRVMVARGRKSFMFAQGEEAGKELSLVVSCTRVGVNPVDDLADVLDRVDKTAYDGKRDRPPLPISSRSDANDVEKRRSGPRPYGSAGAAQSCASSPNNGATLDRRARSAVPFGNNACDAKDDAPRIVRRRDDLRGLFVLARQRCGFRRRP